MKNLKKSVLGKRMKLASYLSVVFAFVLTTSCKDDNHGPVVNLTASDENIVGEETSILTADASDEDGDELTYEWYLVEESGETKISDATGTTYTTPQAKDLTENVTYAVVVSDHEYSDRGTVTITVNHNFEVSVTASETVILDVGSVVLTAIGCDSNDSELSYSWYQVVTEGDDSPIDGANGVSYTTEEITETTSFYVVVNNGIEDLTSEPIEIIVNQAPIVTVTADQTEISGSEQVLLTATAEDGDNTEFTYQWYLVGESEDTLIEGATEATYTTPIANDNVGTSIYYVVVSDAYHETQSEAIEIVATHAVEVTLAADVLTITTAESVTLTATTLGASHDNLTYTWYQDEGNITDGANESTLSVANLEVGEYNYYVIVTDDSGDTTSNTITITVTEVAI